MNDEWGLLELFRMGGVFMWPLLAFSVATIALIIERVVYILYHNLKVAGLRDRVMESLSSGDLPGAKAFLETQPRKNTSASIMLALIANARFGENRMEKAAEAEAQERLRRLENGFNYLTSLASLAPLTGFLGTVSGMIGAFKSIANATEVNAQLVANGIYEALITTVFGLCIAIVALVAYNLLLKRIDDFAADITKAVSDLSSAVLEASERAGGLTATQNAAGVSTGAAAPSGTPANAQHSASPRVAESVIAQ